ncbi:M56 family metallopeptidase [Seonamhaeicola sp.]|uniref:M56 family metallopeptidase n=1 Tax=Seonamhaeicola sp. TaxID=1912245 RepID=UPI002627958E|nr:M56 family metallopeptidase [Seonamhaeicola sp.]
MEYLLKASAVVVIFYACYKLFLQRDTFFESNRGFLLTGLVSAFLIPLIVIPVYIERTPVVLDNLIFDNAVVAQPIESSVNLIDIAAYVYFIGAVFFLGKFLVQLVSLALLLVQNKSTKFGRYRYVKTSNSTSPFSFFNWIVYNPALFNKTELDQILTHEKVHARQHHSIDILLTQLAGVVLWFNPFIWLYNKDLKQNLEFIADQNAQQKSDCKKSYQYTLLKTSMPTHQLALTNNFYNSLIKKRIVMLHKSKSKKTNLLKYALVIPVLAVFLMSFNTKEVFVDTDVIPEEDYLLNSFYNEETPSVEDHKIEEAIKSETTASKPVTPIKKKTATVAPTGKDVEMFLISKHFSDADFDKLAETLKEKGITAKFKGIKRNSDDEIIAIKIELSSKHSNANYSVSSDKAIKSIKISFENNGKNLSIGNASHHKGAYFISKDGKHKVHKSGKGKNVFFFSDDDDDVQIVHEDIHIVHGDTLKWHSTGKDGKHVVVRKHKNVEVITDDDGETHVEVIVENDDDVINEEEDIVIIRKNDDDKKSFKVRTLASGKSKNKVLFMNDDDNQPLFIIDGKEVEKDLTEDLNPDDIKTVMVLKGEQATNKYGDKGKNGVVLINTKNDKRIKIHSSNDKSPLIYLNGKEITQEDMDKLDKDTIESIDVIKGESAIKKYGGKGKNGVINITTKKE